MSSRNPHAGLPITDDDASIAKALEDVSIPTLMLSLVHITGDAELIRGRLKPQGLFLTEVRGFMSEEDKARVRALALEIIGEYRDSGHKLPAPPSLDLIREMMSWLVCQPVPEEYVPMMLEEMELDGRDAKALLENDQKAMEPTQAAHDEYYERTQKELETLVWSHSSIKHSWYKNAEGKIHILSPWRLVDYWTWTREPNLQDFELS
jgi:hypothetical protein